VIGFKDQLAVPPEGSTDPITDCHGYLTVILEIKQRESLPNKGNSAPSEAVSVPIGAVYLTGDLWKKLRAHTFHFGPSGAASSSPDVIGGPFHTPAKHAGGATPSVNGSLRRDAGTRAASVASSVKMSSIFANMVFGITFAKKTSLRETIANLILKNGGHILEDGFEVLFEKPSNSMTIKSTAASFKSANEKPVDVSRPAEDGESLVIKQQYKDVGFVALITDDHYRRQKYIEALALNLPCLHYRWLLDSVRAGEPLPFPTYLLPAGASAFLDPIKRVIRSRTLMPYDPASQQARFEHVVGRRDKLLAGQTVLLIAGKGRDEDERVSPYLFLTNALGARKVGRCVDLNAARTLVVTGEWDWLYVGDKEGAIEEAEAVLFDTVGAGKRKSFGAGASFKSKKRKREVSADAARAVVMVRHGTVSGKRVGIVGNEFVVQSLILGALIPEDL
jgi:hypothetical protein